MNRNLTISLSLLLAGLAVVMWAAVTPGPADSPPADASADRNGPGYTVTDRFVAASVNRHVLRSDSFALPAGQPLTRTLQTIRQRFGTNPYPEAVLHGNSARVPVGWVYLDLLNATDRPQSLVLSMPQYRCNGATLFASRANGFGPVGTLRNTTPLGQRFFPFPELAFPLTLPPRARLPLLLRTESRAGFHEVNLRLSQQPAYVETALGNSLRDGLEDTVFLIIASVAWLIGWFSRSRLLVVYGVYLYSLCLALACQYGYLSFLPWPDALSVNAATVGTLGRLLINITFHPFLYEVVKPALRHRQRYRRWAGVICAANAGCMALHLIPFRYYGLVNYPINMAMTGLSLVNIGWIGFYAVLAWRRAGIWSLLVVSGLVLAPVLLGQLLALIQVADWQTSFRQPALNPLLILLALSYLTVEQFRRELVTRQRAEAQVRQARDELNALRRQEIDGIGRDLHDEVGNTLAAALGHLSRVPADTSQPRAIILSAIRELRFLSHNLVKDDDRPLTDKVGTLVARFGDFAPMQLSFSDYTNRQINDLSAVQQQHLYSIVQELLTNIVRHSRATQASIQFFCDGPGFDICVEDDGIGFAPVTDAANGIGIQNIYKRAELAGMTVRFDPAPTGTSVLLKTNPYAHPNPAH